MESAIQNRPYICFNLKGGRLTKDGSDFTFFKFFSGDFFIAHVLAYSTQSITEFEKPNVIEIVGDTQYQSKVVDMAILESVVYDSLRINYEPEVSTVLFNEWLTVENSFDSELNNASLVIQNMVDQKTYSYLENTKKVLIFRKDIGFIVGSTVAWITVFAAISAFVL